MSDSYCSIGKAITISKADVLTSQTKREILTSNLKYDCLCNPGKLPAAVCNR